MLQQLLQEYLVDHLPLALLFKRLGFLDVLHNETLVDNIVLTLCQMPASNREKILACTFCDEELQDEALGGPLLI